ncbi:hypothetical protein DFH07DRAFT_244910 [Mycena maculata]|uniref:Uncharacterized protein n=1 Tax=Mycena maculata TaxID=230809 RepID=A0AAD7HQX0_9AGAR|nr:hypothetical protein DFH07DRAFT_244910 [Mycena maculata]
MTFSQDQNPGDPTYRRRIGEDGLVLRWSTTADRAGCILLSCIVMGQQEGKEAEFAARYIEPYTDDAFYSGSSTNWALCVDTSSIETDSSGSDSGSYMENIRTNARSAQERVVALVYFLPGEFSFDSDAVRMPMGIALIVACRPAYRQRAGDENVMKSLFEMVHSRAVLIGCSFMAIAGIPSYYRTHGYEYALNFGRGLVTHVSALRAPNPPEPLAFSLRSATLDDLPALERLFNIPRTTADIFAGVSAPVLHAQLRWFLGDRPAAYTSPSCHVPPFFILEKRDMPHAPPHVVAAGMHGGPPSTTVGPLLWDSIEDASAVTLGLVRALKEALDRHVAADGIQIPLKTIQWNVGDTHPLRRWLIANELAVPPESSRYDHKSTWWAVIPSLPAFLSALAPALNVRLASVVPIFGKNYVGELHIAAPRALGGDVLLRVADGVVSVGRPSPESNARPNLSLPRGALVQLMLGYMGWGELKSVFPDVVVEPAVVPLVEALFPKREGVASSILGPHHINAAALSFEY